MKTLRSLCLGMALWSTTLAAEAPVDVKNPPQGRFSDEWLELHLMGGKVGYAHSTMNRDGDTITTAMDMFMRMGRVDQPITIEMTQSTKEYLNGQPIAFSTQMQAGAMSTKMRGTIQDAKVTIVTSQFGMDQTQIFDFKPGWIMSWGLYRESMLKGFTPGTEYVLKTYAPDLRLDGPVDVTTVVGDWETFEHEGLRRGQRVTAKMAAPIGELEMTTWVDANGVPLKMAVPAPGLGDMVMYATDQASALADFVPPELFMTSTVKADRKLDYKHIHQIKFTMRPKKQGAKLGSLPDTGMQSVHPGPNGASTIVVRRQDHHKPTHAAPVTNADMSEFLSPNLMINTKDPQLIELAHRAAGNEKDPYKLADRLRRFVTDYITEKNLTVAFATASEVCRMREGDCSEHGILLAALGRINGLPSRVVAGLAYVPLFGQQQDIFGYHMWTEFYIDHRWVNVDAALRETQCNPARIAMATSSLKNAGMADLSLPLLKKIGAIDLQVIEIDGHPVQLAADRDR
ncbi:MAG: transglutaminase family protein [Phycisphaerae bacterium]